MTLRDAKKSSSGGGAPCGQRPVAAAAVDPAFEWIAIGATGPGAWSMLMPLIAAPVPVPPNGS